MTAIKTLLALSLTAVFATTATAASFSGTAIDGDTTAFSGVIGDTLDLTALPDPSNNFYFVESLTLTVADSVTLLDPFKAWFNNGTDGGTGSLVTSVTDAGLTTYTFDFGTAGAWSNDFGGGTYTLSFHDLSPAAAAGSVNFAVTAVPEPESYAMIMAGLGALGFLARRRKSV